jgi:hypothetical protein
MKREIWRRNRAICFFILGIILLIFAIFNGPVRADEVQVPITIAWDAHDANERVIEGGTTVTPRKWSALRLYERTNDGTYNREVFTTIPVTYNDQNISSPVMYQFTRPFTLGVETEFFCVIRAVDEEGDESVDSNEPSVIYDFTPFLSITDLQGTYNDVDKSISLTWSNSDSRTVNWKVYQSVEGSWQMVGEVLAGSEEGFVVGSVNAPEGILTEFEFVIVQFSKYDGFFSDNSNTAKIIVDKRITDTVMNVRILVE